MSISAQVFTLCVRKGYDLKGSIEEFVVKRDLKGSFIISCVGSVKSVTLALNSTPNYCPSFPVHEKVESYNGHFEICSLVGTVSLDGSHLHTVLGRADGSVIAGHVIGDMEVENTAEVIIGNSSLEIYSRVHDSITSFNELKITNT